MKMIIESRCRLCGARVTEEACETQASGPVSMQAILRSRMIRRNALAITHDCGRGRTGMLEVVGMFPADEPEEKE